MYFEAHLNRQNFINPDATMVLTFILRNHQIHLFRKIRPTQNSCHFNSNHKERARFKSHSVRNHWQFSSHYNNHQTFHGDYIGGHLLECLIQVHEPGLCLADHTHMLSRVITEVLYIPVTKT
ncbi:hypothetical protein FGIG_08232 [Fasciola gigantica]|uniref:Uncharacterized protein n=1 Tax=Fasciola gigantica TaxID=46835 RepID=A0A504YHL2_FASGI|nr:hypothetical protein FGIG_08232 [Fasciola gigantica]